MRIKLDTHETLNVELQDGRVVRINHSELVEMAAGPEENIPDDGFFLTQSERDNLASVEPRKISVIIALKQRNSWSLKMCKRHVEAYQVITGLVPSSQYEQYDEPDRA